MKGRKDRALRLDKEKGIVALLLVLIALSISFSAALVRVDHLVFDFGQRLYRPSVPEDIVIVAVDEDSLARIGRWPWSRQVHARLLNALCAAKPAVIGFDIAFSENSADPAVDVAFARAMAQCGKVVLPLVIETASSGGQVLETPPVPELATVAAGLGRVGVHLDDDGIARSVVLREGVGSAAWPLFAEELLRVGGYPGWRNTRETMRGHSLSLVSEGERRLSFAGPPGTIAHLSFWQVLEGQVPPEAIAGKTVLVGSTAVGLGDFLPTPVSAHAQPMSGVEVQANIWLAMREGRLISPLPAWGSSLLCVLLALLPLLWLPHLMPLPGLLASTLWVMALGLVSAVLPGLLQIWFAPTGALFAGLSAFPLWSWRRLEAARRHLDLELQQLGRVFSPVELGMKVPDEVIQMSFEQRIEWVQAAQRQIRQLEAQRNEALAFISHDLRSPLANAVQRLESEPACDSATLLPSLRRAHNMAQDFLLLARAEALDQRQMKSIELISVLHQSIDEVYSLAKQRGFQINEQLPEEPVWVMGDFAALERCTINLLQNALTYAPEGTQIILGLDRYPATVCFWVENEAVELDTEKADRLFQRFSRGDRGGNNPGGTGLGLYYVRTVAEKHGGKAGGNYADGKIRFWVNMPIE